MVHGDEVGKRVIKDAINRARNQMTLIPSEWAKNYAEGLLEGPEWQWRNKREEP
jgi:hypothetical protein